MPTSQLIIDLSGSGGLAPKFWGDSDMTSTIPNIRYFGDKTAYAEGFFNPWIRHGYTSPSVSTLGSMTTDNAFAAVMNSCIYDDINDDLYFAENGKQLFRLDGLDDTSFTRVSSALLSGTVGAPKYNDLEIYQRGGVRFLYAIYNRTGDTFTADSTTDYISFTNAYAIEGGSLTVSNTGGGLPGGLSANTTYYMVNVSGITAQLSLTLGGAAINITSNGTGTQTATGNLGNIYGLNLSDGTSNLSNVLSAATNPLQLVGSSSLMRIADNGFMYLLDGNAVHKFDGTINGGSAGTVTANVLLFPPHFTIVDGLDNRGLMFIAVHQTTLDATSANSNMNNYAKSCGVYIWDRLSSIVNTRDYISIQGVKAIRKLYVSPDGQLRIICIAANGLTQIREYTGSTFSVIKELGLGASPQYPDSLTISTSHTFWLGNDGTIYSHGKINPDDQEILAKIGYIKAPSTSPSTNLAGAGAVHYGASNGFSATTGYRADRQGLTISYNDSGTYAAVKFFPFDIGTINSNNQNALAGNIYTGLQFLPQMSTVYFMNVFMATGTATGSSVQGTISIYFNGSATAWASKDITRDDISKGYKRIEINKPYINSIQIKLVYPTSVVMSDSYDFHPSFASVHYTPTLTKG